MSTATPTQQRYRIGKRTGGDGKWLIKTGRFWKVCHRCDTLQQAAEWLVQRHVDIRLVDVQQAGPWKSLGQHIAEHNGGCPPNCGHSDSEHVAFERGRLEAEARPDAARNPYSWHDESVEWYAWEAGAGVGRMNAAV
jgi:hypothetical protein